MCDKEDSMRTVAELEGMVSVGVRKGVSDGRIGVMTGDGRIVL